ncbi:Schizosaccharomyces specific protein Tam8 [Schizosaccharomyces pombe]|uniref:Uncharacterized protein tam8 n=1 Tax=Schizosaccharomyces pombe (strain 972 / ATCC 24843) TaxID=284812 RepID=TAM8_SCHPO|nr:protein tam8 [Schizosaccharomyces pombe]G2TRQ2.1 RecName: Full=Uncharacterized protein tam8; AltName: Full=Transcripts altered in meiosis protein 8 [Schizosaccharomyces pombe 972h-]CCD31365.1 sequence orphan [Schizosaccharomyces pombe]|eukprot:NP_001343155.1 protein tam8 [Schizosaccharomyces pombe]
MNRTSESVEPQQNEKTAVHWSREWVPVVVDTYSNEDDEDNEEGDESRPQRTFLVKRWVQDNVQVEKKGDEETAAADN